MKFFGCRRFAGIFMLLLALTCGGCQPFSSEQSQKKTAVSVQQLNDPAYTIAVSETGPAYEAVKKHLPKAKRLYMNAQPAYDAVKSGKADAYVEAIVQLEAAMANGLSGVKILPEKIGDPIKIAIGISKNAKYPGLKNKLNAFIAEIIADGTYQDLYQRWIIDNNHTMPDIPVPEKADTKLVVGTTGLLMPFSYYEGTTLTGTDVEFARRLAKWLGAELEFKLYNYEGLITAAVVGDVDCVMSNLFVTPERADKIDFSDTLYTEDIAILVKDDAAVSVSEASEEKGYYSVSELDGKRIGVFTGAVHDRMVKKALPKAECVYFDSIANALSAVTSGKIDALAADGQIIKALERENSSVRHIDEYLEAFDNAFIAAKTPEGDKIRTQLNEFIRSLKSDGTLAQILDIWEGTDESKKTLPDYANYPDINGSIRIAADNTTPPFTYVKDGRLVGYEIDIIARFCKAYGYRPDIDGVSFPAIIPGVMYGKYVIGVSSFTITEERKESVNFTEPTYTGGAMLLVRKTPEELKASESNTPSAAIPADKAPSTSVKAPSKNHETPPSPRARFTSLQELAGKNIGAQTGTPNGDFALKAIPTANIQYFDGFADIVTALKMRKIDAAALALNAARFMLIYNEDLTAMGKPLAELDAAPIFAKTDKGRKLCEQFSTFIKAQWDNGTLQELDSIWFGRDESKRTPKDYASLPAPNGVLKMAVDTSLAPFAYVKDNKIAGYEIDCAVKFCQEYGYGLEVIPMNFGAIIAAVQSGKCDFASCTIAITPERAEQVLFASPNAKTGSVLVVRKAVPQRKSTLLPSSGQYSSIDDLAGKRIGVQTGTRSPEVVKQFIPTAQLVYHDSPADNLIALRTGKIDAVSLAEVTARQMMYENDDIEFLGERLTNVEMMPIFSKTEKGRELREEYSEFVKALRDNGTLKQIESAWLGNDESKKTLRDYRKTPDMTPKGTLRMAVDTSLVPFVYVKDNMIVGYDIDIAVRFCEAKGYDLEVVPMVFSGIIPAVNTGKCDFSCSLTHTPERAENVLFASTPNSTSGSVIVVMKDKIASKTVTPSQETSSPSQSKSPKPINKTSIFIEELKASFNRTFLREDRWRLFVEGIINTMIITVLSILFGTVLGFVVYLLCRGGNVFANLLTRFFIWLIEGTPMVVLLMILYYIIFGKVDIPGIWVAVIAFTLTFGAGFYGMLRSGTGALDRGQTEAAYALGFSDTQTFFTVILPQAALHFMPAYKSSVVALIKSTAIVGYIAVQDLTKMGDIVRSRTYEAFFPLIAVAAIYFVLAGMLNIIVGMIHNRIRPEKRTKDDILKGVDSHD